MVLNVLYIALFSFEGTKPSIKYSCSYEYRFGFGKISLMTKLFFVNTRSKQQAATKQLRKRTSQKTGDNSIEVTPVPIPNTVVKLNSADDTWWEAAWESRTPPVFNKVRWSRG